MKTSSGTLFSWLLIEYSLQIICSQILVECRSVLASSKARGDSEHMVLNDRLKELQ